MTSFRSRREPLVAPVSSDDASTLAREARRLADAGQHEEAAHVFRRVIEALSPDHWWASAARQHYGTVLVELGRHADALLQFEVGLQEELRQDQNERSPAVVLARCRLGEQLCRMGAPERALQVIEPALRSGTPDPGPHVVAAEALRLLARPEEFAAAASAAIAKAAGDHAEELRKRYRAVIPEN